MPQCVDIIVMQGDQSDFSAPHRIFSAKSSWVGRFARGGEAWHQVIRVQRKKELSEEMSMMLWSKMCWFCEMFETSQLAKIDASCDTSGVTKFMLIRALRCASFGSTNKALFERLRGWKKVVKIRSTSKTPKIGSPQKSHLRSFLNSVHSHDSKDPQCCAVWSHFGFYFWGRSFCLPQKSKLRIHLPSGTWMVFLPPPQVQHTKTNIPTKWNPRYICSKSKKVKEAKNPTICFQFFLKSFSKKSCSTFFFFVPFSIFKIDFKWQKCCLFRIKFIRGITGKKHKMRASPNVTLQGLLVGL